MQQQILIQRAKLIDGRSPLHEQTVDMRIRNGLIKQISSQPLHPTNDEIVLAKEGLHVSYGWMDVGVQLQDPGHEYREDWESVCAAAAAGGFTDIACRHDGGSGLHTKALIRYALEAKTESTTRVWPIGTCMHDGRLSDMMDMHHAGAVAFSNNVDYIADNGNMLRALQYMRSFGGTLISDPLDWQIALNGQMHEGSISTSLGLRGIPQAAEIHAVERDLRLVEYTGARLHLMNISCRESVELVRAAKARELPVTASVAALNLCFTHEDLRSFDTNLKVLPPLRTLTDRHALAEGLVDGTIDTISCNHVPWHEEAKKTVFPDAEFGTATLETAFSLLCTYAADELPLDTIISAWTHRAREVYQLRMPEITEGQPARLTLFVPEAKTRYTLSQLHSKSASVMGVQEDLRGRVLSIVNQG